MNSSKRRLSEVLTAPHLVPYTLETLPPLPFGWQSVADVPLALLDLDISQLYCVRYTITKTVVVPVSEHRKYLRRFSTRIPLAPAEAQVDTVTYHVILIHESTFNHVVATFLDPKHHPEFDGFFLSLESWKASAEKISDALRTAKHVPLPEAQQYRIEDAKLRNALRCS